MLASLPPTGGRVDSASHPTASLMRAHNAKARARHTGGSAAGASQARIAARGTVANDTPVNTVSTLEYPPAGRCAAATNRHEGTRTPSASDRDLTRHTHWVGTRGYSQVLAGTRRWAEQVTEPSGVRAVTPGSENLNSASRSFSDCTFVLLCLGGAATCTRPRKCWPADG